MAKRYPGRPRRLERIFPAYDPPLYYVTFCTWDRHSRLADVAVHEAFINYAQRGVREKRIAVGRYMIMPDHVQLFVRGGSDFRLSRWEGGLKRAMSEPVWTSGSQQEFWQPGFFDHVLRRRESYEEKWEYVRLNPVRAGLVARPEDWPYQGEIVRIDWDL